MFTGAASPSTATRKVEEEDLLAERLRRSLEAISARSAISSAEEARALLKFVDRDGFERKAELLTRACFALFEIGQSSLGIELGETIALKADAFGATQVQRRIHNIIGLQYGDIADFPASMWNLEKAVSLARMIDDPLGEAASLANVIAVLQEMGHYRQAISMADLVLRIDDDSLNARMLKLQCASNGLFAAHRVRDTAASAHFLERGEYYLSSDAVPLRRAFFERSRALYLIDRGQATDARRCLETTIRLLGSSQTARIESLVSITSAIVDWANGEGPIARAALQRIYVESKKSRLYHHFVLQALVKCYSDASSPAEAATGMGYAKELVEFTTSVKKAKFYRQLQKKRVDAGRRADGGDARIDPFDAVRDWLSTTDIQSPPEEGGERRELAKHEELTAIHEDMAKLRTLSIRRDIRTDAVDTAENWAIAAEFFDDETGQHCYRVGHLASMLAREVDLNETFCVQVEHAARLHDIGKIAVNELILLKPGPLDAAEMAAMRLHTEVGGQILGGSDDPTLRMAADVARHHHEWWNGAGYPAKLVGRQIPMSARICAYADVYDALTHARAYKKAWTHERAIDEIVRLRGTQFDPELLDPFVRVLDRYRADLEARAIPGFADMDSNALIASRRKLMETIAAGSC